MKKFMAVYIGSAGSTAASEWQSLSDAERAQREQTGMQAWGAWMETHRASVLDHGGPLGKTKRASRTGIADIKNNLTGYVVIQAESHDAAVSMFNDHPHFRLFPGDAVEVMECLPIPGT